MKIHDSFGTYVSFHKAPPSAFTSPPRRPARRRDAIESELSEKMSIRAETLGRIAATSATSTAIHPFEHQVERLNSKMAETMASLERVVATPPSISRNSSNLEEFKAKIATTRHRPNPVAVNLLRDSDFSKIDIHSVPPKLYSSATPCAVEAPPPAPDDSADA